MGLAIGDAAALGRLLDYPAILRDEARLERALRRYDRRRRRIGAIAVWASAALAWSELPGRRNYAFARAAVGLGAVSPLSIYARIRAS
jgi:2-polyprenyl-6-methoxyphenol hydroxylase-like FAD-dependent oxidoreductase